MLAKTYWTQDGERVRQLLTVWFGDRALRSPCDVIGVVWILLEQLTKLRDHSRVVLAISVIQFDVEIEAVHEDITKGAS